MSWRDMRRPTPLARALDVAHSQGVTAASAGLCDAGLGASRLAGDRVQLLAEAAVSSATPFLRAPLLTRLSAVRRLHPPGAGLCPTCSVPKPCPTALEVGL